MNREPAKGHRRILAALAVPIVLFLTWEWILQVRRDDSGGGGTSPAGDLDYLHRQIIPGLPVADRFDFPLRPPDGEGTYLVSSFGERDEVGEVWAVEPGKFNGAEPVFACADGLVVLAENLMSDWGHVVIVLHRMPEGLASPATETFYAGLGDLKVVAGDRVRRGQWLGSLPAESEAALRLEVRTRAGLGLGPGASPDPGVWTAPTPFIRAHRP